MADHATASAPGRVNLIGEHTDYHDGYVLPTVIPQRTSVHMERRDGRTVRVSSDAIGPGWHEYTIGREEPGRGWLDYVQGVTAILAREGECIPGFDVRIESNVPLGAGVSSSAALEIGMLRGLRLLLELDLDDLRLALLGHAVETDFVGAPVGVMDQMASSIGRDGEALLIDTRQLTADRIPLPSSIRLLVIDSGITHAHAGGEYVTRRRESFEAANLLGVERLRDLDLSAMPRIERLPSPLDRRARHIVTENQRVLEAADALRAQDADRLGRLFTASHASMRDDYETSTPDIDRLVAIASRHRSIHGARLTGGGFGGAVVLVANADAGLATAHEICDEYVCRTGQHGHVLVPMQM